MTETVPIDVRLGLDAHGTAAPPRQNGTLVFAEPWERRVFGVAMALHQAGRFEWEDFRQRLIAAIAEWEAEHPDGEGYRYYDRWLVALQRVAYDADLVSVGEHEARVAAFATRPAGHDHEHPHGDHDHHAP
jgi:nitrile hydratase accessory protein